MSNSRRSEAEQVRRGEEIRFENLERLVIEAGSAARLARRAGMSESYLSRIRRRRPRRVSVGLAGRLEAAMGKPSGWMDEDNAPLTQGAFTLPVVSWEQAVFYSRAAKDAPGTAVPVASVCHLYSGPHTFVLQVKDTTMAPVFDVRDLVFVDPTVDPSNGKYVVVLPADAPEAVLRQYVVQGDRSYYKTLNAVSGPSLEGLSAADETCGVVLFKGCVV